MNTGFLGGFFSNIAKKDTYKSIAYILLSVPLSIIYFTLIITGIALGVGLFIVWIGIPLLILTLGLSWWFGVFEVKLAKTLLNAKIERNGINVAKEITIWQRLKTHLKNALTWKILAYEILKLPIAIVSFTIFIIFLSVTIGLISVPFIYTAITINWGFWTITTSWDALILLAIGLIMLFVTLDITLFLGKLNRLFAEAFLLQKAEIKPNTVQAHTEHKIREVQQTIVPAQMPKTKPVFKTVTRTKSVRKLQKKVPTKKSKQTRKTNKAKKKKTVKKNPKKTIKRSPAKKKKQTKKTNKAKKKKTVKKNPTKKSKQTKKKSSKKTKYKKTTKKVNKKSKRKTQTKKILKKQQQRRRK